MALAEMLDRPAVTQAELAKHLDSLSPEQRVEEIRALGKKQQHRLWEVCAEAPPFSLEDLVPPSLGEGQTVIFAGKNSLGAFTHFEKRFQRRNGAVIGYNHNPAFVTWFAGPGYFTCVQSPQNPRELLFDYTQVPSASPDGWPKVKANRSGGSYLVYRDLHDYNRRVSKDVLIGFATRLGKPIDSYFVLARTA
jgi:hypothetical protein